MRRLKLANFIHQIHSAGKTNTVAVALILTEMRFRGPLFRVCEVAYALWILFATGREPTLTLGTCQVSFSYWRQRFGSNHFELFRAVFDDVENYEVCCLFLRTNSRNSLKEMLLCYNGSPSVLYVTLFFRNLALGHIPINGIPFFGEQ